MALENMLKKGIVNPMGILFGSLFNYVSLNGFCTCYNTDEYTTAGLITLGILDLWGVELLYINLQDLLKPIPNLSRLE